jgi:tetratricopeptide (TPR) repeat protein
VRTRIFVLILTLPLAAALVYGCGSKFMTGAKVHIQQEEFSEAIPLLENEIDSNPGNVEAYVLLGQCFCEIGDFDSGSEAFDAAEALIAADPEETFKEELNQTRMFYWSKAFEAGRIPFNDAITLLDSVTLEDFERVETGMTYNEVTNILGKNGELTTESEMNGHKYEDYTWDNDGHGLCSVIFLDGKADTKTQVDLPSEEEAPIKFREAIDGYKACDQIYAGHPKNQFMIGFSYEKIEEYEKAFAAYGKAVHVKKDDMATNKFDKQTSLSDYVIKYANAALKTENYDEASETLERITADDPDNTELLYAYAVLLLNIDAYDKAAEVLGHIIEIDPGYDDAVISMGNLYLREEWSGRDARKTIEILEPLLETDEHKGDFQLYASLGKAYQNLGNNKKAAEYYKKAQELYDEQTGGE